MLKGVESVSRLRRMFSLFISGVYCYSLFISGVYCHSCLFISGVLYIECFISTTNVSLRVMETINYMLLLIILIESNMYFVGQLRI